MKETESAAGKGRSRRAGTGAAQDLLRQGRQLKEQLARFDRSARRLLRRLTPRTPELEVETMSTPAANLMGALECLLEDDFAPALKKLLEVDTLLRTADPFAETATTRRSRQATAAMGNAAA